MTKRAGGVFGPWLMAHSSRKNLGWRTGVTAAIFCLLSLAFGPRSVCFAQTADDGPVVIQTELTLDNAVQDEAPAPTIKPSVYEREAAGEESLEEIMVKSGQIIQINRSLKNAIEENSRLYSDKEDLDRTVGILRGQRQIQAQRQISLEDQRDKLRQQRDQLEQALKEVKAVEQSMDVKEELHADQAKKLALQIKDLREKLAAAEEKVRKAQEMLAANGVQVPEDEKAQGPEGNAMLAGNGPSALPGQGDGTPQLSQAEQDQSSAGQEERDLERRIEVRLAQGEGTLPPAGPGTSGEEPAASQLSGEPPAGGQGETVFAADLADKDKSMEVIQMIDRFHEETEALRKDEARVHYNMGNVYFYQGKYEKALLEYREAVTLMPEDPKAHFNLAFVSSEFMKDWDTAVPHYRQYLMLEPEAKDAALVQEKLLEAELIKRTTIPSDLEKDVRKEHSGYYR